MNDRTNELPRLDGKKILITGGLGFIGSNLARVCLARGADVTIYDCLDPNSGGNLFNVHDIRHHVELRFHDILNFDRLAECVLGKDILVNCAASTSHPFSMKEPLLNLDVNSRGVINLLEACRRFNRDIRFIHLGTTTQLGKLQYQPADERHPEFPTDIYSANKCASEKYVLIYATAHGIRTTVLRLSNTFGPRAAIHSSDFTFNNFFVGLALQDREITVFGEGGDLRNVLYVDDAVSAIIMASLQEHSVRETLFAVGDHHYSITEIARATVEQIGSGTLRHVEWPADRKAIDIGHAIISNARIKELLPWRPAVGLEEGLRLTRDYFRGCVREYLR
ncbi:MAG TPA: NAD-dependent epimerase/dehydratase family protein [Verrucomicrobiae bacterium]|nr:NAD-dependent epimerase/dehydratase family protein [Verrucomicrobiae bacterium]